MVIKIKNGGKMVDLKKEDQEYLDSEINKQNKTDKINYYKTQNKSVFILSFAGILLSFVLGILFTPIEGQINILVLLIIVGLFAFSASYMFLSFILEILSIFIKKLKEDHYTKFTIQMVISSVIVIVVLILVIIGNLLGTTGRVVNPEMHTSLLLRQQINNPGSLMCTDVVTFQKDASLVAQGITKDTGLDYLQVYFANPEGIPNFNVSNHSVLKYTGTSKKNVVMCIICDEGKTGLQEAAIQNGINTTIDSNIEYETLCLVYPKKTA